MFNLLKNFMAAPKYEPATPVDDWWKNTTEEAVASVLSPVEENKDAEVDDSSEETGFTPEQILDTVKEMLDDDTVLIAEAPRWAIEPIANSIKKLIIDLNEQTKQLEQMTISDFKSLDEISEKFKQQENAKKVVLSAIKLLSVFDAARESTDFDTNAEIRIPYTSYAVMLGALDRLIAELEKDSIAFITKEPFDSSLYYKISALQAVIAFSDDLATAHAEQVNARLTT